MTDHSPPWYDPVHRRHSVHLRDFDYRATGAYFVTLCTADRSTIFGTVAGDEVHMTQAGRLVEDCWNWLAEQYLYVTLDAWVLMPNHLHGILAIGETPGQRKPLGRLIGAFKTVSTKRVNELRGTPGAVVWQRDYYEHIVRSESDLASIRQYITDNPRQWALDRENPCRMRR